MFASSFFRYLACFIAVVSAVVYAGPLKHHSKTHYIELNITRELIDPDCSGTATPKLLVNGQFAGPTIAVTTGDHVKMLVRNLLPSYDHSSKYSVLSASANGGLSGDITIHCHGIRQLGSPAADGVPFLSQDPIKPQQSYLHEFQVIDQAGTYFYHAHVGLHSETVFGAFIVYESEKADPEAEYRKSHKKPFSLFDDDNDDCKELVAGPYHYDDERTIIISEWWNQTAEDLGDYTLGTNFTDIPEAPSVLINGRTVYEPEINAYGPGCQGYSVISVDPEKTYRIRIIGANDYRTIYLAIGDHALTIIEVDGTLVQPYTVPYLEIAPGQRFSILLEPCNREGDYAISTIRRWIEPEFDPSSNGLAVLRYTRDVHGQDKGKEVTTFSIPDNLFDFPGDVPFWYWPDIAPIDTSTSYALAAQEASRTITLRASSIDLPTGEVRWYVNNITFIDPNRTILASIFDGERPIPQPDETGYDATLNTYPLKYMEVVDIVLQTTRDYDEPCRMHPWHMHGYSFVEIAFGPGRYQHKKHGSWRNVPNPFLRDVVSVYPIDDPEIVASTEPDELVDCGWTKIRIVADNPGVFPVHCHNNFHMIMGMMAVIEVAPEILAETS